MAYTIKCGNATVKNYNNFNFENTLNGVRFAEIFTDGNDATLRAEYVIGNAVTIHNGTTLKFQGEVYKTGNFQGGGIIIYAIGQEVDFTVEQCPIDSGKHTKVWTSTDDDTIFASLVGEISGWSSDVSGSTPTSIDAFRVSDSMNVWVGIQTLLKHGNKDIYVNDDTKTIYLTDAKGTSGNARFEEGKNCSEISWTEVKAIPKVVVYGKGDGAEQIIGSSGSGTPVKEVIDRNIISVTEANARAVKELALISTARKRYTFLANNPSENVETGDTVVLSSTSAGISSANLDITRIKRGENSNGQFIVIEVTNTENRIAKRNVEQQNALSNMQGIVSRTSMQGSGNLSQWTEAMNANSSYASVVNFTIGSDYFADEAGNLRVSTLKFDYDVDKFREGYGKGTYDGDDVPLISSDSGDNYDLTVTDEDDDDISLWEVHAWEEIKEWTAFAVHGDMIVFHVQLNCLDSDDLTQTFSLYARVKNKDTGDYYPSSEGVRVTRGKIRWESEDASPDTDSDTHTHTMGTDTHSHGYNVGTYDEVRVYNSSDDWGYVGSTETDTHDHTNSNDTHDHQVDDHSHDIDLFLDGCVTIVAYADPFGDDWAIEIKLTGLAIGDDARGGAHVAYSVESRHKHNEGGYETDGDLFDKFTIGDDVGESSSTNATSIDIHLDHWNGSSWDLDKHTIINTGSTLEIGVDISDSGTYPDATGLWRVRTFTNKSSPDLVISRVSVKHEIDN